MPLALVLLTISFGGCISAEAYNPQSTLDAWKNYVDAFGSNDVDKIMLDYTENSIVELFDAGTDMISTFEGITEIRNMLSRVFEKIGKPNPFTFLVDPIVEEPSSTRQFGQVFLHWEAASGGYPRVTETFIYGKTSFKIIRQNIVTFPSGGCPMPTSATDIVKAPASSEVQQAWENHYSAFISQNINSIMRDYNADSKVMFYDNVANSGIELHQGTSAINAMFTNVFAEMVNRSDLALPLTHTSTFGLDGNKNGTEIGQTFVIWRIPASGYAYATDTIVYNSAGVIVRQNVVAMKKSPCAPYNPQNVSDAWKNHVAAFRSNDLDKIMLDYTENSVVTLYDAGQDTVCAFEGLAEIREIYFTKLFRKLGEPNPSIFPVDPVVEEPSSTRQFGQVFLLWEAASKGLPRNTDTFIYGSLSFKIMRQNFVVFPSDGCPEASPEASIVGAPGTSVVQKTWERHQSAFVARDLNKIMLGYSPKSKWMYYDTTNSSIAVNEGTAAIEAMFTATFTELAHSTDLSMPIAHTSTFGLDGNKGGAALGQTCILWRSPMDRYAYVTDTLVYNSDGVILRHNTVAIKKDPCEDASTTTTTDPFIEDADTTTTTDPLIISGAMRLRQCLALLLLAALSSC